MSEKRFTLPPADVMYTRAMKLSAEIKKDIQAEAKERDRRTIRRRIADALDLAVLKPTATVKDVIQAAELVEAEGIASICVAPYNVGLAKQYTRRVCSVVGFPHGNQHPGAKLKEAQQAISDGAIELDVVINYGRFLEGRHSVIGWELTCIVNEAHKQDVRVKAILETYYYREEQIYDACKLCMQHAVDWVKTSTGFGPGGATPEAVATMLHACAGRAQVKASGGINTYADAVRYLDMGCTRIGSSKFHELLT